MDDYDSDTSHRFTDKKNSRDGVLYDRKKQSKNTPNNKYYQRYWMLFKKDGMPECKYKFYSSENWFAWRSDHESIKEGLGGNLGNRDKAFQSFQKSEDNWKRYLKALNKPKTYALQHGQAHQFTFQKQ